MLSTLCHKKRLSKLGNCWCSFDKSVFLYNARCNYNTELWKVPPRLTSLLNLCYILNAACAVALFLCKYLGMFQIPYGPSYYRATKPSDACNMSAYFENRNCTINNVCYRWLNLRLILLQKICEIDWKSWE